MPTRARWIAVCGALAGAVAACVSVAIASAALQVTITGGPSGTVTSSDATFTFTANESDATFKCSLDGASLTSCSSPKSYSGLADGNHTFVVEARNQDPFTGQQFSDTDQRDWTVAQPTSPPPTEPGPPEPTPPEPEPTPRGGEWSIGDATVTEGPQAVAVFNVTLSEASDTNVSVNFATADGSAKAGSDYEANSGTIYGGTTQLEVPIVDDQVVEGSETFSVNLSKPTGGTSLGDSSGTGTILNDDSYGKDEVLVGKAANGSKLTVLADFGGKLPGQGLSTTASFSAQGTSKDGISLAAGDLNGN